MTALVLDAEPLSLLARAGRGEASVRAALYRGGGHDQAVDACLARQGGIDVVPTDERLARAVGHLLAGAGAGSEHHVDATVVATCGAAGGGLVLTGDVDDLAALAAQTPSIEVRAVAHRRPGRAGR